MRRSRTFECLACSAPLEFAAGSTSTRCAICDDDRPLPVRFDDDVAEIDVAGPAPADDVIVDRTVAQCTACKAIVSAPSELATCPFCASPMRELADTPPVLRPQGVLPRLVDEHTARAAVAHALSRVRIAGDVPHVHAVHVPWLLYSCALSGSYEGRRGEFTEGKNRHLVWHDVGGPLVRPWDNMRGSASMGLPRSLAARLEPWDWAFCEPYAVDAIATSIVEHTPQRVAGIFARLFPNWELELTEVARSEIGGDRQEVRSVTATRHDERARLVLLPVWVGRAGDAARTHFAVNGRTGEVAIEAHILATEAEDMPLVADKTRVRREYLFFGLAAITFIIYWLAR